LTKGGEEGFYGVKRVNVLKKNFPPFEKGGKGGISRDMLRYDVNLKDRARELRKNATDSEYALWSRLRNKHLLGVQFYRQKPIGGHIVDLYAPKAKLVIEIDGSQHLQGNHIQKDRKRDESLASLGLKVLRFDSREVLKESDAVMDVIYRTIVAQLHAEIPPNPPFSKGGLTGKSS
jgi:very-short-patch-repair endonuclease